MDFLLQALSPANLLNICSGTVLGILIGAAPGLGPVFALAILLAVAVSALFFALAPLFIQNGQK